MKSSIVSRGSTSVTGTSSAEKIVAYSTPMTRRRPRSACAAAARARGSRRCRTPPPVEGHLRRRCGGSHRDQRVLEAGVAHLAGFAWSSSTWSAARKASAGRRCAPVAHELVCSTSTSWSSVFCSRWTRSPRDFLLDPVAPAIEAALAPAGEVQHRLAQRLRRDRAGMHRTPPSRRPRSTTSTDLPSLADCTAARRPAGPLPITSMSIWSMHCPPRGLSVSKRFLSRQTQASAAARPTAQASGAQRMGKRHTKTLADPRGRRIIGAGTGGDDGCVGGTA